MYSSICSVSKRSFCNVRPCTTHSATRNSCNSNTPLVKTPHQQQNRGLALTRSISSKPKLEANRRTQSSTLIPNTSSSSSNSNRQNTTSHRIIRPIQSTNSLLKKQPSRNGTSIAARGNYYLTDYSTLLDNALCGNCEKPTRSTLF